MERIKAGQIYECEVSDFGMNGEGVVKIDGGTVFVPYAIKGETVRIRISYSKGNVAFADLIDVLSVSSDRIKPVCPYFMRCGGCDLQHVEYNTQLEIKRVAVERALKKITGRDFDVPTPVGSARTAYRNKLSLPFGMTATGKTVLGFYEKKTHKTVPMKFCPLHGEWAADLISAVTEWANGCGLAPYDEKTKKGLLRHAVARMLDTLSLTVVVNGESLPYADKLIEKLNGHFEDFALYVSPNTSAGNVILGETARLLYGRPQTVGFGADIDSMMSGHSGETSVGVSETSTAEDFNGKTVRAELSPLSFLQVNDNMRETLYSAVCSHLSAIDGDILELYSGIGLLTAEIASRLDAANITAVEVVSAATENANFLMSASGLENRVNNVTADAAEYIGKTSGLGSKFKTVILDPPRKGCDASVIGALTVSGIENIVYISCNPPSLSRDLKLLTEAGYSVKSLQLFDMFPQTSHIETLVCLTKKN